MNPILKKIAAVIVVVGTTAAPAFAAENETNIKVALLDMTSLMPTGYMGYGMMGPGQNLPGPGAVGPGMMGPGRLRHDGDDGTGYDGRNDVHAPRSAEREGR